ncbi:MAG TPA: glutamate racemase [Anaerolineae bacterium]|nr:glutamate racemase [Anaerolineae bacterium]HID83801.1 glutamate racemase [Anaerolineales bacterium]HIQ07989.1 glutamate racemase [Anaerolineaceae bacterium]
MTPALSENKGPIGVFDSGVGGLSVLRAIRRELPHEDLLYLADQAHVPYGLRPLLEVRRFAEGITRYFLDQGAKAIVVACNTASAAALHYLRRRFPQVPFVGMEPAVKPAAKHTQTGVVGVLATPATFQGQLYASVVERFTQGTALLEHTCPGLVQQIERGDLEGPQTRAILEEALRPMLTQGMDTVVLGCTHYPFVIPLIEDIVGPGVRVIDPAPAVARQTQRVLAQRNALRPPRNGRGRVTLLTTGANVEAFAHLATRLLGESHLVKGLTWGAEGLQG